MALRPNACLVPLICVCLSTLAIAPAIAQIERSNRRTPLVEAVENCRNSVVNLRGQKSIAPPDESLATDQVRHVNGMGTGVVIDRRGYILTNYHVVQDIRTIQVTLGNRQSTTAKLVARDPITDLAIIKIEPTTSIDAIHLGTSSDLMLAETVAAVGNAYGYENSVTTGIISHLNRTVQINDNQVYEDLIQIDAPINPGNSGGPLLNMDGKMIGINVAVRVGAQGIAFAIPVNDVVEVAARLMEEIVESRISSGIQVATRYENNQPYLLVTAVDEKSAAYQAGLAAGDRIRSIDGALVSRALDWQCALIEANQDDTLKIGLQRPNGDSVVSFALERPKTQSIESIAWSRLGLRFSVATEAEMLGRHKDYQHGLKIEAVRPNSPAEKEGIKTGDILVAMHGYMTESYENLAYILDQPELKENKHFMFYILRERERYFGQMRIADTTQSLK